MTFTLKKKVKQAAGKARRFVQLRFRKQYVASQTTLRQGACRQCGKCCELLFRCPFMLRVEGGSSICSIYEGRPGQCAAFPISTKCLADVDYTCGFNFVSEPSEATKKQAS